MTKDKAVHMELTGQHGNKMRLSVFQSSGKGKILVKECEPGEYDVQELKEAIKAVEEFCQETEEKSKGFNDYISQP